MRPIGAALDPRAKYPGIGYTHRQKENGDRYSLGTSSIPNMLHTRYQVGTFRYALNIFRCVRYSSTLLAGWLVGWLQRVHPSTKYPGTAVV